MTCGNCLNLKEYSFTWRELEAKWQELYSPTPITAGYRNKYVKAAAKTGRPFDEVKIRFIYCSEGLLTRFYLKRGGREAKIAPARLPCSRYR